MNTVLDRITSIGIVPVIKLDQEADALPLAKAMAAGGLKCAEITFRTQAAEGSIRAITQAMPDMLVGAGTVLTIEQADRAIAAGAQFIVTPGFNPAVVAHCLEKGVPIVPGTSSPSDIEAALSMGLNTVKFFPAESLGGLKTLKALAAPYGDMRFIPTGGISAKNMNEYLAFDKILAVGGSWMVDPALISAGNFEAITALCKGAIATMLDYNVVHVGVNTADAEESDKVTKLFCAMMDLEYRPLSAANFAGALVEVMKGPGRGKMGHIGFGTPNAHRAYHYLKEKGFAFDESTLRIDTNGRITFGYLVDEIGGFAIHIINR